MDAAKTPEENIKECGFWHCLWTRFFKMILDVVHIRSLIFICGSCLATRFMHAYLADADKTPNEYLGIAVVVVWFLLAIGVAWNRTWEEVWAAFCEALKNYKKS